jgi:hypothetical protein
MDLGTSRSFLVEVSSGSGWTITTKPDGRSLAPWGKGSGAGCQEGSGAETAKK